MNSVYLSGPNDNSPDPDVSISTDWKSFAASKFLKSGIIVANPLDLDISKFIKEEESTDSSVKESLNLIDKSDSVLANLSSINESSVMEVFYAHRHGKQVVVVSNDQLSPWITSHCEKRFKKLQEALDYLVDTPSKLDLISWSTQNELLLNKQAESYPEEGKLDYEYHGGTLPILVLAPHATASFNNGELKERESYTGTIAKLLNSLTGCHALSTSHCTPADPVYFLNSPFVTFMGELTKKIDFKLILVLHGLENWNTPSDFILSSWKKNSLIDKVEYQNLLLSMLKVKGFKDINFDLPEAIGSKAKTINEYIFEDLKIPTLRLEIHKRNRIPHLHPDSYSNMITSLAQFLMTVA